MPNENEQEVEQEVEVTNETSHEDNSETESDGETVQEQTDKQPETPEAKRARLKRQLEQLDKKHGFKDEEAPKKSVETEDERYDRLELKTEGIKDKKSQDAVIEYARFKKIDVLEALNSPAMKAELKEIQAKSATPSPSKRTGGGNTNDVAHWAEQLTRNGKSAPTPELRAEVRAYLAKGH